MSLQPNRLECDAILFDLDGVLLDSTGCFQRHWKDWAGRHGLDFDQIRGMAHGVRTIETMRLVAPHLDVEKEAGQFNANEVVDTAGVVAIEGARKVLRALPKGSWAIVTSGSSALARARLRQAGLPVPDILVTADDVRQGKPAPEPYLRGAERLGIAAERCVVIEDAPAGITAGKKAGMRVIGIPFTHQREELWEHGADMLIDQLTQLQIQGTGDGRRLVIEIERRGTEDGRRSRRRDKERRIK